MVTFLWTPVWTNFLYKYRLGKKIRSSDQAPVYSKMHEAKSGTPTMGGVLIWMTTLVLAVVIFVIAKSSGQNFFHNLNFLTRQQTLLPLGALIASAIVGLIDDIFNVRGIGSAGGGLRVRHKLIIYTIIAIVGAYWFFYKLDWTTLHIPFIGNFDVGIWYIPFFIFVIVSTAFSVNEIDGLDGLSGGTLLTSFGAFGVIALVQGKIELATFCGVIIGASLAFLWFNINPARFFMGDTGAMSLGVTLGIVAMLTNNAFLLPIIGFPFVLTSISVIVQMISKRVFHKKILISSPLHHHLEAKGWPEPKIVMRYWIVGGVTAVIGIILFMLDK